MMGSGLRPLQDVLDLWNIAAALPAGLTVCVIAYAGIAWTQGRGEAKPVTGTVHQVAWPAALASATPLLSSQDRPPAERTELSTHHPLAGPPFPRAGEAARAAEVDDFSTSQPDPAVVQGRSTGLIHEGPPQPDGKPPVPSSGIAPPAVVASPVRDVLIAEQAREVQRRLTSLGYFKGSARGSWGPLSRQALAAFKRARQLPLDDVWDAQTESALFDASAQALPAYVGVWALEARACSARRETQEFIPLVIESHRARAGKASCSFRNKREVDEGWDISAECTSSGERWTAQIRLSVSDARLTWTSERGTEQYVWCTPLTRVAGLR